MTGRAVIGELTDLAGCPDAACHECHRNLVLADPLEPSEVALCRRCALVCVFRGLAWAWVNPRHQDIAQRLSMPLDGLLQMPPELAVAITAATTLN